MGSISRYIFRTTLGAFLVVLVSLTAVIWVTQALRDIDIMTSQGQTILVFIGITGLIIPLLVLVIAPIALLIAVAHVLNKLSNDSEIIVMNAAGMSPWILFRAFMRCRNRGVAAGDGDQRLFRAQGPAHAARLADRGARQCGEHHRSAGPFHARSKAASQSIFANGAPTGNLPEFSSTTGAIRTNASPYCRRSANCSTTATARSWCCKRAPCSGTRSASAIPAMVVFDRYAFDLSQFAGGPQAVKYSIRERYLWQLLFPDPKDQFYIEQPGQFRAELHDRLMAPFYPIAFVVIAFAYLGAPRTTRQSRTMSMLGAIGGVALLRLIGLSPRYSAPPSLDAVAAIRGGGRRIRLRTLRDPPRSDSGPPAFITDWIASADRAPHPALRRAMSDIMPIFVGTLARYFGLRFLGAVLMVFVGIFALVALLDYIEMMRRASDIPNVSAVLVAKTSFYRVPQVIERILPFCVLIGAMSCYLNLSRRLELVVARSAGMSAWQFVSPALVVAFVLGVFATDHLQSGLGHTAGAIQTI